MLAVQRLALLVLLLSDAAAGIGRPDTDGAAKIQEEAGSSDHTCDPTQGECAAGGADADGATATGCTLYLAPSSVAPDAGLGVYSGRKIAKGESVHEFLTYADMESEETYAAPMETAMFTDIFVAIFHTGRPFRSWMGYVWPPGPGAVHTGEGEGLALADGDVYLAEDGRHGHE